MKHRFAFLLAVFLGLPILLAEDSLNDLFRVAPYVQTTSETTVTLLCLASGPVEASVVVVPVDGSESMTIAMTTTPIPDTTLVRCAAVLGGLKKASSYGYQVTLAAPAGTKRTSPEATFRTLDQAASSCRFVIFNDLHSNTGLHAKLCEIATAFSPELVFYNGDCWQDPSARDNASEVVEVLNSYVRQADHMSIPLAYVMGNHEWRGSFSKNMAHLFPLDSQGPEEDRYQQRHEFALSHGSVRFVCMDAGEDGDKRRLEFAIARERQRMWLEEELAKPVFQQARWRVLIMHIPIWESKWNDRFAAYWRDTIQNADPAFDLMICGHTHRATHLSPDGHHPFPIIIGGGKDEAGATCIQVDANESRLKTAIRSSNNQLLKSMVLEPQEREEDD